MTTPRRARSRVTAPRAPCAATRPAACAPSTSRTSSASCWCAPWCGPSWGWPAPLAVARRPARRPAAAVRAAPGHPHRPAAGGAAALAAARRARLPGAARRRLGARPAGRAARARLRRTRSSARDGGSRGLRPGRGRRWSCSRPSASAPTGCGWPAPRATSSWPAARSPRCGTPARSAASTCRPRASSAWPGWCWRTAPTRSGTRSASSPATSCCCCSSPRRCAAPARTRCPTSPSCGSARRAVRRRPACSSSLIGWLYLVPQLQGAGLALRATTGAPAWVGAVLVAVVVVVNVAGGGMRSATFVQAFQYWLKLTALAVPAWCSCSRGGRRRAPPRRPGAAGLPRPRRPCRLDAGVRVLVDGPLTVRARRRAPSWPGRPAARRARP